jgi:hypothetical protein
VRLNLETAGEFDSDTARRQLDTTARQIDGLGWHVQFFTRPSVIAALQRDFAQSPFPLVIDHFGNYPAAQGVNQPHFDVLIDLIKSGRCYVKVSGAYRISDQAPHYPDAAPLARALIAANEDRIVWGTDWPHPGHSKPPAEISPPIPVDDAALLNQLPVWHRTLRRGRRSWSTIRHGCMGSDARAASHHAGNVHHAPVHVSRVKNAASRFFCSLPVVVSGRSVSSTNAMRRGTL